MALTTEAEPQILAAEPAGGRSLRIALFAVIAVAALSLGCAVGYLVGHRGAATPSLNSVDAGFAWDMSVHHQQAVTMAGYTRDHTTDGVIKTLAYDIETSQFNQVGQMQGWLDSWGLPPLSPNTPMSWMSGMTGMNMQLGSDGQMPGMASQAQLDKLETLTGKALDVFFLQLMLHHHQGGLPMAQWAAGHAQMTYVRNAAQKMVTGQSAEIVLMEQLLRERGASPLPPPS